MKVVILCGGIGSRMKEETEFRPKPMVKIGEQPILWHIMKYYAHFGYKDFVLALGYKGEMVKDYFANYSLHAHDCTIRLGPDRRWEIHGGYREDEDWSVTMVNTGQQALKGARMKRIAPYIPEDDEWFMMTYGDGVTDMDLTQLSDFHFRHGKKVTVTGVIPSMRFGELATSADGRVIFREKERGREAAMVNGGFYIIHRSVLDMLEDRDSQDFEYGPLETLSDRNEVRMNRHLGFWHCMDHIRDMEALNRMWVEGQAPWKIWSD